MGAVRVVSGKVERDRLVNTPQIAHPDYLVPLERADTVPAMETVYPATAGLPSRTVRRHVLAALERAPELPEWLDPAWLARHAWPPWRDALASSAFAGLRGRSLGAEPAPAPAGLR